MASAASLSAAMNSRTGGFSARASTRVCAPASAGESTSVVSDAGWKPIVSPASRATGSAVPTFQPSGTRSDAVTCQSSARAPLG